MLLIFSNAENVSHTTNCPGVTKRALHGKYRFFSGLRVASLLDLTNGVLKTDRERRNISVDTPQRSLHSVVSF